jgi:hypothetical protein
MVTSNTSFASVPKFEYDDRGDVHLPIFFDTTEVELFYRPCYEVTCRCGYRTAELMYSTGRRGYHPEFEKRLALADEKSQ